MLREIDVKLKKLNFIGEWYSFEIYQLDDSQLLYLFKEFVDIDNRHFTSECKILDFLKDKFRVLTISEFIKLDKRIGFTTPLESPKIMAVAIREEPKKFEKFARILGRTHAKLHNENHTIDMGRHDDYMVKRLNSIQFLPEYKDRLMTLYWTCHDDEVLCHHDYGAFHVLLEEDKPYVIDWVNASLAPAEADVAKCIFWTCSDYVPGIGPYLMNKNKKVTFVDYYLDEYRKTCVIDDEKLLKWLVLYSAIEYDNEIEEEPDCEELELYLSFVSDYFEGKDVEFFDTIVNGNT